MGRTSHQEELVADWNLVMKGENPIQDSTAFSKEERNMYPSVSKVVPNEDFTLAIVFDIMAKMVFLI